MGTVVDVASPYVCDHADVVLAHELMQSHRVCRIDRCVWKTAPYWTLVATGRLVPPRWSPRERAAARGIALSPLSAQLDHPDEIPTQTIRDVLSGLSALCSPAQTVSSPGGKGNH